MSNHELYLLLEALEVSFLWIESIGVPARGARGAAPQLQKFWKFFGLNAGDSGKSTGEKTL